MQVIKSKIYMLYMTCIEFLKGGSLHPGPQALHPIYKL